MGAVLRQTATVLGITDPLDPETIEIRDHYFRNNLWPNIDFKPLHELPPLARMAMLRMVMSPDIELPAVRASDRVIWNQNKNN